MISLILSLSFFALLGRFRHEMDTKFGEMIQATSTAVQDAILVIPPRRSNFLLARRLFSAKPALGLTSLLLHRGIKLLDILVGICTSLLCQIFGFGSGVGELATSIINLMASASASFNVLMALNSQLCQTSVQLWKLVPRPSSPVPLRSLGSQT